MIAASRPIPDFYKCENNVQFKELIHVMKDGSDFMALFDLEVNLEADIEVDSGFQAEIAQTGTYVAERKAGRPKGRPLGGVIDVNFVKAIEREDGCECLNQEFSKEVLPPPQLPYIDSHYNGEDSDESISVDSEEGSDFVKGGSQDDVVEGGEDHFVVLKVQIRSYPKLHIFTTAKR